MRWDLFNRTWIGVAAPDIYGEIAFNDDALPSAARERLKARQAVRIQEELAGKIILIDFWDYSCINCINTLPYLKTWWKRYRQYDFLILGIHTPEFEFGGDADNVRDAVIRFGLNYPVISDPQYITWHRYRNNVWPRKFLVDKQGIIQYDHRGEGEYQETEAKIQELIRQVQPQASFEEVMPPLQAKDKPGAVCLPATPEIYLGVARGVAANEEHLQPNVNFTYHLPVNIPLHGWALAGQWRVQEQEVVHGRSGHETEDRLVIHYIAAEVFAVMRTLDLSPVRVVITQDGQPLPEANRGEDAQFLNGQSLVEVTTDRFLYRLVKNPTHGEHSLELSTDSDQLALHTFTFGTTCQ
jgi:hypothetical protein